MDNFNDVVIFCDLDGTLIFDENINEKDKIAIRKLKEQCALFYINTGRPLRGVLPFLSNDNLFDGISLMNGSLILDKDNNPVYKSPIPENVVKEIYKKFKKITLTAETENHGYIYPRIDYEPWYKDYFSLIESYEQFPTKDVFQICIYVEKCEESLDYFLKNLQNYPIVIFGDEEFIDINNDHCDKGKAIEHILSKQIRQKKIIAIGDSYNDIPMFKKADLSFIIGNRINYPGAIYCRDIMDVFDNLSNINRDK